MTRSTRPSGRPARRSLVLLVMAVLTGVLGMHGLAPGVVPAAHAAAGHGTATARTVSTPDADRACAHTDGGGPGHLAHADGTCAAAGIGSAYTPPALPGTVPGTPPASTPAAAPPGTPHEGRAPPDLSELQLLRI